VLALKLINYIKTFSLNNFWEHSSLEKLDLYTECPILKPSHEYFVREAVNPKIIFIKIVGFVEGHRMMIFNSTLNLKSIRDDLHIRKKLMIKSDVFFTYNVLMKWIVHV